MRNKVFTFHNESQSKNLKSPFYYCFLNKKQEIKGRVKFKMKTIKCPFFE